MLCPEPHSAGPLSSHEMVEDECPMFHCIQMEPSNLQPVLLDTCGKEH